MIFFEATIPVCQFPSGQQLAQLVLVLKNLLEICREFLQSVCITLNFKFHFRAAPSCKITGYPQTPIQVSKQIFQIIIQMRDEFFDCIIPLLDNIYLCFISAMFQMYTLTCPKLYQELNHSSLFMNKEKRNAFNYILDCFVFGHTLVLCKIIQAPKGVSSWSQIVTSNHG